MKKIKVIAYHIPYSKKAQSLLRRAKQKFGISYSISEDEIVSIIIKENYIPRLEKFLLKNLNLGIDKQ